MKHQGDGRRLEDRNRDGRSQTLHDTLQSNSGFEILRTLTEKVPPQDLSRQQRGIRSHSDRSAVGGDVD